MKKLKILVGTVALFAIVVVNVWNAATCFQNTNLTELKMEDVENYAVADPPEDNSIEAFISIFHNVKTQRQEVIPCSGTTERITRYYTPFYYEQKITIRWQGTEGHCHEQSQNFCFEWECTPN